MHIDKGENTILFDKQDEWAPNITQFSIVLSRLDNLKYARWQLVTYNDLVAKLKNENADLYGGTAADATFLLKDQGFTRNIEKSKSWDIDNSGEGDNADFIKNTIGDVADNGMYWNARITGKGKIYQDIDVPMYGVYQFDAYGFYKGSPTQMYYQYAKELNADGTVKTWSEVLGKTPLVNDESQTYTDRSTDITTGQMFYNESVLGDNKTHLNTQFVYVPQDAATNSKGEYRIRIGFDKTANADGDYTAVDDIHLHYTGKAPFIINDDWTQDELEAQLKDDDRENIPIWIKREFWPKKWNAVVFPVSVSTTTLRAMFGDGVEVASPYGLDDKDPMLIRFTPIPLNSGSIAIEAGKFYIVRPSQLVGSNHVMNLKKNADGTYTPEDQKIVNPTSSYDIRYYNLGNHNIKDVQKTVPNLDVNTANFHAASKNTNIEHNTIEFHGSYTKTKAPARSYVFASDGNMYHLATEHDLNGFRFFIVDIDKAKSTSSKGITIGSLSDDLDAVLASFEKNNGEATGIKDIDTPTDRNRFGNGDVYDLSGRRVATDGKTDNLPSGVYIMNGRKFVKK